MTQDFEQSAGVIRCPSRIVGVFQEDGPHEGLLEVKCNSKACKEGVPGAVVFHYFDIHTGVLKDTVRYREPQALFHDTRKR